MSATDVLDAAAVPLYVDQLNHDLNVVVRRAVLVGLAIIAALLPPDASPQRRMTTAVQAWAIAANKAGSLEGSKVAAVLDTFDEEPLVIGPTGLSGLFWPDGAAAAPQFVRGNIELELAEAVHGAATMP